MSTGYQTRLSDEVGVIDASRDISAQQSHEQTARKGAADALASVMLSKMKPSDRDYARRLLARTAPLTMQEISWLLEFARWYDEYNKKFWDWWEAGGDKETASLPTTTVSKVTAAAKTAIKSVAPRATTTSAAPVSEMPPVPEESSHTGRNTVLGMVGVAVIGAVAWKLTHKRTSKKGK